MINTRICPTCHKENSPDRDICIHCNSALSDSHPADITERVPEAFAKTSYPEHIVELTKLYSDILVFQVLGYEQPIMIKGSGKTIIGRRSPGESGPTVDLTPYNANLLGVSRQHAAITRSEKGYILQDLGSTNGTWHNEVKLSQHKFSELRNGDLVRVGQLAFYVYFRTVDTANLEETIRLKHEFSDSSTFRLTPHDLAIGLTPYLNALSCIQTIYYEMLERPEADVTVTGITVEVGNPVITIKLSGAKDAIRLAKTKIAPWREAYVSKVEQLWEKNGANGWKGVDASPLEPFEINSQTDHLRQELRAAEAELAASIVADVVPPKATSDHAAHIEKLLGPLHTITFSPLQIVLT